MWWYYLSVCILFYVCTIICNLTSQAWGNKRKCIFIYFFFPWTRGDVDIVNGMVCWLYVGGWVHWGCMYIHVFFSITREHAEGWGDFRRIKIFTRRSNLKFDWTMQFLSQSTLILRKKSQTSKSKGLFTLCRWKLAIDNGFAFSF